MCTHSSNLQLGDIRPPQEAGGNEFTEGGDIINSAWTLTTEHTKEQLIKNMRRPNWSETNAD